MPNCWLFQCLYDIIKSERPTHVQSRVNGFCEASLAVIPILALNGVKRLFQKPH